jgi:hypothetical protein
LYDCLLYPQIKSAFGQTNPSFGQTLHSRTVARQIFEYHKRSPPPQNSPICSYSFTYSSFPVHRHEELYQNSLLSASQPLSYDSLRQEKRTYRKTPCPRAISGDGHHLS